MRARRGSGRAGRGGRRGEYGASGRGEEGKGKERKGSAVQGGAGALVGICEPERPCGCVLSWAFGAALCSRHGPAAARCAPLFRSVGCGNLRGTSVAAGG